MSDEKRCDCCKRYWYVDDLVSGLCPNCLDFLATKNQMDIEQDQKIKELEHRLSNCIEPKFIYGQYVWCVYPENEHRKGFVFKMDFVGYTKDKIICCINENEEFDYDMVFATEEEAKAKLEELKNG